MKNLPQHRSKHPATWKKQRFVSLRESRFVSTGNKIAKLIDTCSSIKFSPPRDHPNIREILIYPLSPLTERRITSGEEQTCLATSLTDKQTKPPKDLPTPCPSTLGLCKNREGPQ